MIIATLFDKREDVFNEENICFHTADFEYETLEELRDLLRVCLSQGKCLVISSEKDTERGKYEYRNG